MVIIVVNYFCIILHLRRVMNSFYTLMHRNSTLLLKSEQILNPVDLMVLE